MKKTLYLLHQVNCQPCYTKYKAAQCVRCNKGIVSTGETKTSLVTCQVCQNLWDCCKSFKIAFFCTCLKTVWIAFPKCQFDRHCISGQELPRAVLHLRWLQRVFERPVCLRCDQWWDCLLWMWHQEERLEMWLMVKLCGTPFVTNTKWKLSWVSCC